MPDNDTSGQEDSGVECPTCGELFSAQGGMKIHHAQKHGESLSGVVVTCEWCESEFRVQNSRKDSARFCSYDCHHEWMSNSDDYGGENHPSYNGGLTTLECEFCQNDFDVRPYRVGRARFCSVECKDNAHSVEMSGPSSPFWKGDQHVSVVCESCGDEFTARPHREGRVRFCSIECRREGHSSDMMGENHPRWNGGVFSYGDGWNEEKKEQVRERDGRVCLSCGLTEDEHIEKYGQKHHVHHIMGAKTIDDEERRNHPDNLITLCLSCHLGKWENIPGLRPDVR